MQYRAQIASLRRVKSSSAMPNSDQPPPIALSRELTSSADLKFVSQLKFAVHIVNESKNFFSVMTNE